MSSIDDKSEEVKSESHGSLKLTKFIKEALKLA